MSSAEIIAHAARTPVGLSAEASAAAIRAGVSRVAAHPFLVDGDGEPLNCGLCPAVPPTVLGTQRLLELALQTLRALCRDLTRTFDRAANLTLFLALPEPRPGFDNGEDRRLLQALGAEPVPGLGRLTVRGESAGHAGGLLALKRAVQSLESGGSEICLVGGVDSYLDAATLDWLDRDRRLACASARSGFPPGEGAAMVAVATERFRRQARRPALAVVTEVACAHDSRDENAPSGLLGEGLGQVYSQVAGRLRRPHERFDDLYCDINAERPRSTDLGFALLRAGDVFRDGSAYLTPVAQTGDLGAATAPLNFVLAARAWAREYASGPNALVSGASWTGLRGAALLRKAEV